MPRPQLPVAEPFEIEGVGMLIDSRSVSEYDASIVSDIWRKHLVEAYEFQMDDRREKQDVCDYDTKKQDSLYVKFLEIQSERGSDYTWDDYEQEGLTVVDDFDFDPRLPCYKFCVYRESGLVGQIPITNMQEIQPESRVRKFSANAYIGVAPDSGSSRPQTGAAVYAYFLENEINLTDGSRLQIRQWKFPEESQHHRFAPKEWNDLGQMLEEFLYITDQKHIVQIDSSDSAIISITSTA